MESLSKRVQSRPTLEGVGKWRLIRDSNTPLREGERGGEREGGEREGGERDRALVRGFTSSGGLLYWKDKQTKVP